MPKRLLMAEEWNHFASYILPPNAPSVQRQEMRRAFYAGAQSILFRIVKTLAPESEVTEADLRIMSDVYEELQDFAKAVEGGRA